VPHSKTQDIRKSPYQVQVLDRALAILETLSQQGPDLSLADISEKLQLHKSTAHRLVMVLERYKLIEKNSVSGRYRLGLKLFELGTKAVNQLDLRERAHPLLESVVLETGETVHLCIRDDFEVVYLDKVEPSRSVRMACSVGRRNPAHATAVGKAMMAYLSDVEVEGLVRRHGLKPLTANTITTLSQLKAELAKIRKRGYAIDDEEIEVIPTVTIVLLGEDHKPLMKWTANNVWPRSWKIGELNAERGEVLIETLELSYNRLLYQNP